jgi:hypothetical protein
MFVLLMRVTPGTSCLGDLAPISLFLSMELQLFGFPIDKGQLRQALLALNLSLQRSQLRPSGNAQCIN